MKVQHKRELIIVGFIAWGIISASVIWIIDFNSGLSGGLSYFYTLCYYSTFLTEPIYGLVPTYSSWILAFSRYLSLQIIIYCLIGILTAWFIYPKSTPIEPSENKED
jgi:hypothetical protein